MRNISFREVNNARIASRMRQFVVLVVAIIIGMIISVSVNAQNSFKKSNARHYKSKFRSQINQYANACALLEKKRTGKPKSNTRLASLSKPKDRTTAEIDYFAKALNNPKPVVAKKGELKTAAIAQETVVPPSIKKQDDFR